MATQDIETKTGSNVTRTTVTVSDNNPNLMTIRTRATTALTTNATFLAIASPTAAQVATQTKALTRQNDAIIRMLLNLLSDISDT